MTIEPDLDHIGTANAFAGREMISCLEEIVLDLGTRPRALVRGEIATQEACRVRGWLYF